MESAHWSPVLRYIRKIAAPKHIGQIPDGDLLHRFVTVHDEEAFAALVKRHSAMVMGVCRRVLNDDHTAEDVFQATFLVLVRKARSIAKPECLGSWLYGVAYRTALRARCDAAKRRFHEHQLFLSSLCEIAAEHFSQLLERAAGQQGRLFLDLDEFFQRPT